MDQEKIYAQWITLRCQQKDQGAFAELISHYEKRLYYYLRRIVNEESDCWDILQEVWLKVIHQISRLQDSTKLVPWLYQITRYTAIDFLRKKKGDINFSDLSTPEPEGITQPVSLPQVDAEKVHLALNQLSLPHREVLTLFFLEDLSLLEIGEILNLPEGTVKSRLYYAKRAMKNILIKEGWTHE